MSSITQVAAQSQQPLTAAFAPPDGQPSPTWAFTEEEAAALVAAAILAHRLKTTPPVWLFILAAPSHGKTTLLDRFEARPLPGEGEKVGPGELFLLDSLTPQALVSGLEGPASILERITDAIFLIKELSSLVTDRRQLGPLLGLLRRVFDGELTRSWGTGKVVAWRGRVTAIMAGVQHPGTLDAELGARLLVARLQESTTDYSRFMGGRRSEERLRLADVTPPLSEDVFRLVHPLARMLATLRGHVPRDARHEAVAEPVVEAPHRLTGQLGALAASLAALQGRPPSDPGVVGLVGRVVACSAPPPRLHALLALADEGPLATEAAVEAAAHRARISPTAARYVLDDLRLLGLIEAGAHLGERRQRRGRPQKLVTLTDAAMAWLAALR